MSNFVGMEVERTKQSQAHKIGAAVSGPRFAGETIYGHEAFSD